MEPEGRAVSPIDALEAIECSKDEHGSGSTNMDLMVEMPGANQDTKAGTDQSTLVGGQLETLPGTAPRSRLPGCYSRHHDGAARAPISTTEGAASTHAQGETTSAYKTAEE